MWVVINHFQAYLKAVFGELNWLMPVIDRGYFGVDLFFCLSGFIIAYVYFEKFVRNSKDKKKEIQQFLLKRFARIYPVYFITTLVAMFIFTFARLIGHKFYNIPDSSLTFIVIFKNLMAIQILDNSPSLNYPAWSVSAEFFAYLLFPLFVYSLFVKFKSTRLIAGILLPLSLLVYECSLFLDVLKNDIVIRVLSEFVMGVASYLLIKGVNVRRNHIVLIRFLITSSFIISIYAIKNNLILSTFMPLLLLGFIAANYFHNIPNKGLGRRILVKLGLWSFSLYLTHGLIHYFLGGFDLPIHTNDIFLRGFQLFIIIWVTLLTAKLTTEAFENPCRRYLIKKLG